MLYEELHQRFGSHIAKRVKLELSVSEFKQVTVERLTTYLETRAENAHKEYQTRLDNPFINDELGNARSEYMNTLFQRWRDAEDLAYLITVAEDVAVTTRPIIVANAQA